ncbi:MAG: NAD(P)(+) transhydrogenase (Re/Si-specific) subunit beta, partial [Dactylosporangium sp.]|nr:NAD(P)(+) transhydrogenase (Re/Si-specific) subunit beta [Dactylosporangium sp.]
MTATSAASAAYIVAGLLFIMSLAGLSKHETARGGIVYGIAGMAIALAATIGITTQSIDALGVALLVAALLIGAVVGLWRARTVEMTAMPELIAILHSFVGLAAVLVGWNGYLDHEASAVATEELTGALLNVHNAEIFIGVFIGAVTFTGSVVAWGKLSGRISSAPLMLPGRHVFNLSSVIAFLGLTVWFVLSPNLWLLVAVTVIALLLG